MACLVEWGEDLVSHYSQMMGLSGSEGGTSPLINPIKGALEKVTEWTNDWGFKVSTAYGVWK